MKTIEELKEHFEGIEFSDKYMEILKYIREDNNAKLSIQGNSGSGKSTLLKIINYMFSDDVENKRMNIAIASSTGVASALLNNNSNIGATTVHSLFALKPTDIFGTFTNSYYKQKDLIANIDCFIFDEVSMISADLFDYIASIIRVCRKGKETRILLFGDPLQLQCIVKMDDPQVKDYYMTNYNGNVEFFSSFAFKDMGFATFLLTKIYRQNDTDEKFKDVLNRIRVCEQTQSDLDYLNQRVMSEEDYIMQNESFLRIVSTNKDVQKYNQIALDAIDGKFICLTAKITGTFRETAEFKNGFYAEKIWVKIGCPIMITRNAITNADGTRDYYNGSMGTLVSCNDDFAIVDLGDREVRVERAVINNYEYELVEENGHTVVKSKIVGSYDNIPIKVCSASTVFKVQGLTLNCGYIDFNYWVPDNGIYVALSRFRSVKDFGLAKPIKMRDIHATQESLSYVKSNEWTESVYEEMFGGGVNNMSEVKLYHGDCLEVMGGVADKSVDLILTDPPYGTIACKWDSVIPFDKMWERLNRIIKDNGAIVLFGSEPFSSALRMSNINNYGYDWIWHKSTSGSFATAKKMPMKYHEVISVFYKKLPTYNPQFQEYRDSTKRKFKEGEMVNRSKQLEHSSNSIQNGISFEGKSAISFERGKYPESVLCFDSVPNCNGIRLHPTQKPVPLLEYLIKTYTLENETVLDFTMGSGSTGVACINTNRNFIGIEKDDNYFEIAKKRIEECQRDIFTL